MQLKDNVCFKRQLAAYYHNEHPERTSADIGDELGFSSRWVKKWWNKNSEKTDEFKDHRKGRKIPSIAKITPTVEKIIVRNMHGAKKVRGGFVRKLSQRGMIKKLKDEYEIKLSRKSVQKILKKNGLSYHFRKEKVRLTKSHKIRRLKFARLFLIFFKTIIQLFDWFRTHKDVDWKNWVNSDSAPFYLRFHINKHNDGIYVKPGLQFINFIKKKLSSGNIKQVKLSHTFHAISFLPKWKCTLQFQHLESRVLFLLKEESTVMYTLRKYYQ
jgi:hypothetical protein